jgi:DNA-binding NarL/FixJ family response regulator
MSHLRDPITVVLIEDHVALRKGIELLLSRRGCVIAGAADDARAGYDVVRAKRPDVAVVDLGLPDGSGSKLARQLLDEDPDQGILLYTGIEDFEIISGALDCGARGFIHKAGPPDELITAIRAVADGGTFMDGRLGSALLARSTTDRVRELSPREREILDLLAQGLTGAQVAKQLFISPETVRTHIRNAMGKLEARTRVHAIVLALRQSEIDFEDATPIASGQAALGAAPIA